MIITDIHMKQSLILGHRGVRGLTLENSQKGFYDAQSLIKPNHAGIDGIEFDVQLTHDHKFCVFHDESLLRLANRQSRIDDLSLDSLKKIQLYDNHASHTIPSLSDMPALLMGYRHIELEVKTHARTNHHALTTALIKALVPFADLPITLTSFDAKILHLLHNKTPFQLGLLIEKSADIHQLIHTACTLDVSRIGFYYPLIDKHVITLCRHYNLKVTTWTVNDVATAKHLQALGAEVIISDVPHILLKHLK